MEERPLLPSFLYLPGAERAAGRQPEAALGAGPRFRRRRVRPQLRQPGADAAGGLGQVVAVPSAASTAARRSCRGRRRRTAGASRRWRPARYYLKHLCEAWNSPDRQGRAGASAGTAGHHPDGAGVLRRRGPRADRRGGPGAGLEHLTLLEEPQAAFYAWIDASDDDWRKQVEVGDVVLVCDVGGGTTDLTLIAVGEEAGNLVLTRVAVGDHILLGGDNMDLALAHTAAAKPSPPRASSSTPGQMHMLWHSCRLAKEKLFSEPKLATRAGHGAGPRQQGHRRHHQGRAEPRPKWRRCWSTASSPNVRPTPSRSGSAPSACRNWACPTPATRPSPSTWPSSCTATPRCWPKRRPRAKRQEEGGPADGGAVQRRRLQGGPAARAALLEC